MKNVAIIGSGPAGLTAAIYLARAEMQPVIYTGLNVGGQLMQTTVIENFPGFIDGIDGPVLMMNMLEQSKRHGAEVEMKSVLSIKDLGNSKLLTLDDGTTEEYKSVIVATGATPLKLKVPGEDTFWGKGVSSCATCDGAFYKGKVVAVIGGGDSAMEEASFLTKFANKVYIVHRRNEFKASKAMQKRVFENSKIEIVWNSEVKEISGSKTVEKIMVLSTDGTNTEKEIIVDGVFLAIGHRPVTEMVSGVVELDDHGFIKVYDNTKTNIEGIFVAGDVRDSVYQQAISAAGMGCMAALDCEKWLSE